MLVLHDLKKFFKKSEIIQKKKYHRFILFKH